MIERQRGLRICCHIIVWIAMLIILFPLYVAWVASTLDSQQITQVPLTLLPGGHWWQNLRTIWIAGVSSNSPPLMYLLLNSFVMALGITFGKIVISIFSAFALVWFRFPFRQFAFWLIFITLMLPIEVRIFPTIEVVSQLNLLNSYSGLIMPMMASATATFLFRQFFLSLPNELIEAARIDGASAIRFFIDIVLPLSRTTLATLFVITFIYGWNQYLWPILITTDSQLMTAVAGVKSMIASGDGVTPWNLVMAAMLITLLPPVVVVLALQRYFVKGLIESEK